MTEQTYSRRLQELIRQLEHHPKRDEILTLAQEQLVDDTFVLTQP